MLTRLISFAFAAAKSRAMASHLTAPPTFKDYSRFSSWSRLTAAVTSKAVTPEELERELSLGYQAFGLKIADSLPQTAAAVVLAYLRRVDSDNLKIVCRWLQQGSGRGELLPLLRPVAAIGGIPSQILSEIQSFDQLGRILADSPYASLFPAGGEPPSGRSLLLLEQRIDAHFWCLMAETTARLRRADRQAATEILSWPVAMEVYHLLQRGSLAQLSADDLLASLPAWAGLEELHESLQQQHPLSEVIFDFAAVLGLKAGLDASAGELVLRQRRYRQLRRVLRQTPFDLSIPLATLLLKELEYQDLLAVSGGLRLQQTSEQIAPLLACGGA